MPLRILYFSALWKVGAELLHGLGLQRSAVVRFAAAGAAIDRREVLRELKRSEPALRAAQVLDERYAAKGLRVIAVNLNHPEIGLQEHALVEKAAKERVGSQVGRTSCASGPPLSPGGYGN